MAEDVDPRYSVAEFPLLTLPEGITVGLEPFLILDSS
jgi:hypothetical protein